MVVARTLPVERLARFIADLEEIKVVALARLVAPPPATRPDELVDIDEAARRLGVSKHYLYRHAEKLQFSRRVGRKRVFSSVGIDRYIASRR
jgi:predicted DNA-binding transcriptional regulator AlpA